MKLLKTLSNLPRGWRDETLQYADRIAANGGSITQGSLVAIDTFVRACQVAGIWSKFIEVGPFAGSNLNAAMVKLVYQPAAGSVLTNSNFVSADYLETGANGGLAGDGTKFLNTNVQATTLPENGHYSFYLREDIASGGNKGLIGALDASNQYWMGSFTPSATLDFRYGALVLASVAGILSKGFYTGVRESATSLVYYRDAVSIATASAATGTTKPPYAIHAWGFDSAGASGGRVNARGSFYSIGQALTPTEVGALHNAVRNLQSALNRAIN
jgi:hypothetical protein